MRFLFTKLLGVLFFTLVGTIHAAPFPNGTRIEYLTYNGTGCYENTVRWTLDSVRKTLNISFTNFTAQLGPGIAATSNKNNCTIKFNFVRMPLHALWAYDQDYDGSGDIDSGVSLQYRTRVSPSQKNGPAIYIGSRPGPFRGPFHLTNQVNNAVEPGRSCSDYDEFILDIDIGLTTLNEAKKGVAGKELNHVTYFDYQTCFR